MGQEISRRNVLKAVGATAVVVGAGAAATNPAVAAGAFAHPGLLHTQADLDRMAAKVKAGAQPYKAGFDKLAANPHSRSGWTARPVADVVRGGGSGQNYTLLYTDIAAAYQNALRWHVTGDTAHADTARDILNAWSGTLTQLQGTADRFLAAGIYGYEFANAAELMRGYDGFDLGRFQTMMTKVFYPLNNDFLTRHNGAYITNYWANWDLCNMASVLAIGILCDDRAKVAQAVDYFKNGAGNGSIQHAVPFLYPGGLGQWQESGRDQGHTMLGVALMGAFCEMAWNQGFDLYGYDDNRFLKGAEYVAKYNLGHDVPFTAFTFQKGAPGVWSGSQKVTAVSSNSRGQARPVWALVENHYVNRRGLSAPYTTAMAAKVAPEGGGGDYGPDSGGYDQLGFGTLAFTRPKAVTSTGHGGAATPTPTATPPATAAKTATTPSPTGASGATSGVTPQGGNGGRLAETGSGGGVAAVAATGILAVAGGIAALRRRGRSAGRGGPA